MAFNISEYLFTILSCCTKKKHHMQYKYYFSHQSSYLKFLLTNKFQLFFRNWLKCMNVKQD